MKKIWRWAWMIGAALTSTSPCFAQAWNAGLEIVNSRGLGFERYYGGGIIEATFNTPDIIVRTGIEVLDAQKEEQEGYGGRFDLTLIRPLNEKWGVEAFYRPSFIDQTDYEKAAHEVGFGFVFTAPRNGTWTLYFGKAFDDYSQETYGAELRIGKGHWARVRYEVVTLMHPSTGKSMRGGRICFGVAPRISW